MFKLVLLASFVSTAAAAPRATHCQGKLKVRPHGRDAPPRTGGASSPTAAHRAARPLPLTHHRALCPLSHRAARALTLPRFSQVQCTGDEGPVAAGGDLKKCESCADGHLKADQCTPREALVFCHGRPGPKPEPIEDKCLAFMKKECSADAADREKCEKCLEKLPATDDCTLKEEFAFCDSGGKPGPKPTPIEDECLAELKSHCEDRRENRTECDGCLKRVDHAFKANCTRSDEMKFCDGEKPKPPAPVSDMCVQLLEEDCAKFVAMKNESVCYECAQRAAKTKPDIACTEREEYSFCTYGPKGEPKCVKELQELCGKPWGSQHDNKTACLDCVVEHEKGGFWTKAGCTRAEVSKFC